MMFVRFAQVMNSPLVGQLMPYVDLLDDLLIPLLSVVN